MHNPLSGEKLAVLVANGFCEKDLTVVQRMLQPLGITMRIIGMNNGLVNSWNGEGWGLNFAADHALNSALAADFSMLIIPGGQRSVEKLKLTAHTRRFIGGFIDSGKPVVAIAEALDLLAFSEKLEGRSVSAPEDLKGAIEDAGAEYIVEPSTADNNLLSISSSDELGDTYASVVSEFLVSQYSLEEAA